MAFLSREHLENLGLSEIGSHVFISDKASFYNPAKIAIGNHVRIDDFCVLSAGEGGIEIGNYVHVAVFSSLIGAGRIKLSDFVNLSSRVSIYSSNDDYTGAALTNPMVPAEFKNVQSADVELKKHVIVGSGSVILPGVTLNEGAAIGALSMVVKDCEEFTIYSGVPVKALKSRKRDLKKLEHRFLNSQ
ncbi:acyltransferase [Marinobacter manganoxydans]|uniref:Hexapeptide repeat-containing transferase n=1 Tax=Marinobacter manganoxydans MnI7-9 TaxID=1094979 RepID=G6YP54_9GAMM|nr:acyltransferase [Marinobacter manganoxydans]EHJ06116.1 hexapeptide repeat-containing transferase [Marinobacter manganoxydans MnI7-9]